MTWGVLNAAMLIGLAAAAVPVLIHVLDRRRDPVVDWGAMQFLELGRRARQRLRLTELLLLLARTALLAAVALALARPFVGPPRGGSSAGAAAAAGLAGRPARDVVLVVDGSAGMDRASGGTTPRARAVAWARRLVASLAPGDSATVLVAADRVRGVVDPPAFDHAAVSDALLGLLKHPGRGPGDLAAGLAEAFRVLESTHNPAREVVLLTDGRRAPWRPGETARWALLRDLQRRLPAPPRVWAATFRPDPPGPDDPPDAVLGPATASRTLLTPGLPLTVSAELTNAGPGPLSRTAELLLDGRAVPGASQAVGPLPAGGRAPLRFRASIASPGSHLLTVRLEGGEDALPSNDESSVAVTVAPALAVLLVDGEPAPGPLGSETDFLRAALAPQGDDAPSARVSVVRPDGLSAAALENQRILVLANVDRLEAGRVAAVGRFLEAGGGVLVAPGDRVDPASHEAIDWMPATVGEWVVGPSARKVAARPSPPTFSGPVLAPFGQGEAPALAEAELFAFRRLGPRPGASVSARLDTGDPWVVERPRGRGRVVMLAGPLDAEGGTLPVNPDFVPLTHELMLHLCGGGPEAVRPGEPLVFDLGPASEFTLGAAAPATLSVATPSGAVQQAVVRRAGGRLTARLDDPAGAGVYRLTLPDPPGGLSYATVATDGREADTAPLEPAEADRLAEGWPLGFDADLDRLAARVLDADGPAARREVWRPLVLLALAGLCVEIYLTRSLVRGQAAAP